MSANGSGKYHYIIGQEIIAFYFLLPFIYTEFNFSLASGHLIEAVLINAKQMHQNYFYLTP